MTVIKAYTSRHAPPLPDFRSSLVSLAWTGHHHPSSSARTPGVSKRYSQQQQKTIHRQDALGVLLGNVTPPPRSYRRTRCLFLHQSGSSHTHTGDSHQPRLYRDSGMGGRIRPPGGSPRSHRGYGYILRPLWRRYSGYRGPSFRTWCLTRGHWWQWVLASAVGP